MSSAMADRRKTLSAWMREVSAVRVENAGEAVERDWGLEVESGLGMVVGLGGGIGRRTGDTSRGVRHGQGGVRQGQGVGMGVGRGDSMVERRVGEMGGGGVEERRRAMGELDVRLFGFGDWIGLDGLGAYVPRVCT